MKEAAAILDSLHAMISVSSLPTAPDRLAEFARTAELQADYHCRGRRCRPSARHDSSPNASACAGRAGKIMPCAGWIPLFYCSNAGRHTVATFAIGRPGAKNAALMAAQILSLQNAALKKRLLDWRRAQTAAVAERPSNQENK